MSRYLNSSKLLLLIISVALFFIPFFWLPYGSMDLGSDSTRLYFYEPLSYLQNFSLFGVSPEGLGTVAPNYYFIPYVLILAVGKLFLTSYFLITITNSFKLLVAFWSIYFILKELISSKKQHKQIHTYAAILGGVFYLLIPTMTGNWDRAILSHNQVFLNPLMFLLLLKFFLTNNIRYGWLFLMVSVFSAPNFGFTSAPAIFSFYPLAILFLLIYVLFIRKVHLPWKKLVLLIVLFFGLHLFHLAPQVADLLSPGSLANTRVFDKESIAHEGIRYFYGVLPLAKVSEKLLLTQTLLPWSLSFVPLVVIVGFLLAPKSNKTLVLTGLFFLVTLFLLTANITSLGVSLYESLFYIPGFTMFRNFIGQWLFVFSFFYALLFGQALAIIFEKFSQRIMFASLIVMILLFVISSWDFLSGNVVNKVILSSPEKRIAIDMDPDFKKSLDFVKKLPDNGKLMIFPFSDAFYQLIPGRNDGLYVSSSPLSYIGGKYSFSGYQLLMPFSETFLQLARDKDYESIQKMFALLNMHYIYYNDNESLYNKITPDYYAYVRQSLPADQKSYQEFIKQFAGKEIFNEGDYHIYQIKDEYLVPRLYLADSVEQYNALNADKIENTSFFVDTEINNNTAFLTNDTCKQQICSLASSSAEISYQKISPVEYEVTLRNITEPVLLVFSSAYHSFWQLVKDDKNQTKLPLKHVQANGYANAWYIEPSNLDNQKKQRIILKMTGQDDFYKYAGISITVFVIVVIWGIILFFPKNFTDIIRRSYVQKVKEK